MITAAATRLGSTTCQSRRPTARDSSTRIGTVAHAPIEFTTNCGGWSMRTPWANQTTFMTRIHCHATSDRPSTLRVRTSRHSCGKPTTAPTKVASQPTS